MWLEGRQEPVAVWIRERNGESLVLIPVLGVDVELYLTLPEPVVLEQAVPRGLLRSPGTAVQEGRELIRFRPTGPQGVLQRRRFVRVAIHQPVTLVPDAGQPVKGFTVDLSAGGMLLATPAKLDEGLLVDFSVHLAESQPPVEGVGLVVRTLAKGHVALRFETISARDEERLVKFVVERQRAALAVRQAA